MMRAALLAALLLAPVAHAFTIPIYGASEAIRGEVYYWPESTLNPIATPAVPWAIEAYGRIDTETLGVSIDALRGTTPSGSATYEHGPYSYSYIVDPPGFDPPYQVTDVTSFSVQIDWRQVAFELVGPATFALNPQSLGGNIAFGPFTIAQISVSKSGDHPSTQALDLMGEIFVSTRCNILGDPFRCESAVGIRIEESRLFPDPTTPGIPFAFTHQMYFASVPSQVAPSLLSGAVPEPSAALLLLLGIGVVAARRMERDL